MLQNLLLWGKGPQFAKLPYQLIRCYSKKSASSKKWLQRASSDHYTKAAKFAQYKSRAAFKLIQLDKQFKLLKPGFAVVDLGFAPGAWTQVAVEKTKPNGRVLGVDIIPAPPPKGASAMQANILSMRTHQMIRQFFNEIHTSKLDDDDVLDKPSYIQSEMAESKEEELVETGELVQFPLDLVISDMYAPVYPPERYWNNTTNSAYDRMANTSGVAVKDHSASIVSIIGSKQLQDCELLTSGKAPV